MKRQATFVSHHPKSILNKHRHIDHWFWTRYSAHPYIGCQHGCEFCYCRERKYLRHDDPDDFAYNIKIKENAPILLRRALSRVPVDLIFTADYQPIERKLEISRQMLEVCYDLGFPVFILERSPLVLRDIDLLKDIETRAKTLIAFSIISTPESPNHTQVEQLERLAPPVMRRFEAMEKFASADLLTGTAMMPVLPALCDDEANLESVVRYTADHGGKFVLAGGLTLANQQREYFFQVLERSFPTLLSQYRQLYPPGSYSPVGKKWQTFALRVRALCEKHGIRDRIPRPVISGDKRALNKRAAEMLADKAYELELQNQPNYRVWAYRKAAWAIEDLEQDIGLVYRTLGSKGLQSIPDVGASIGREIEGMLKQTSPSTS